MRKVLVVDDSGVMRKIITRSLKSFGVSTVFEAVDGADGLAVFNDHEFDLVVTDWNMPNRSGLDLVRDIRATGSIIPIIMVTTEAEQCRLAEAIEAGANDTLAKPFEAGTLRDKIKQYTCV
jgi:two-component system, chemotaxis family, chemotaxis protein CheY